MKRDGVRRGAGALLLCACALLSCGKGVEPPEESPGLVTVTDSVGRVVRVPCPAARVVCRGPGVLRLVYLDAVDAVAAIESGFEKNFPAGRPYRIARPELDRLPVVGAAAPCPQPNPEAILRVRPQVVFISHVEARVADTLQEQAGVPVVVLNYGPLGTFDAAELRRSLRIAGRILGREKRAEEVVRFIDACRKDLLQRSASVPDGEKPTVYVGGIGYKGTHGITSTERRFPLFELLRIRSVVDDGQGKAAHIFVDKEMLVERDPEVIFIDEGGLQAVRNDYRKNGRWYGLLSAVKAGRLYGILPYNFYQTNIGTALADAYYIGKILYPRAFADVDPAAKADEIYTFLVGKPVYAAMAGRWGGFGRISLSP